MTTFSSGSCNGGVIIGAAAPGYQLCGRAQGQAEVRSGQTLQTTYSLCNALTSKGPFTLRFPGGREHDVRIRAGRTYPWTWSVAHTFPQGAHALTIERGYCLTWTTTWDTRDDEGALVAAGAYTLESSVEVNGQSEQLSYGIDITS